MFNNNLNCGIHATRFIASWLRVGGNLRYGNDYDDFREWLETLKVDGNPIPEQDIEHIVELARCGKMEFESSARLFVKQLKSE